MPLNERWTKIRQTIVDEVVQTLKKKGNKIAVIDPPSQKIACRMLKEGRKIHGDGSTQLKDCLSNSLKEGRKSRRWLYPIERLVVVCHIG